MIDIKVTRRRLSFVEWLRSGFRRRVAYTAYFSGDISRGYTAGSLPEAVGLLVVNQGEAGIQITISSWRIAKL